MYKVYADLINIIDGIGDLNHRWCTDTIKSLIKHIQNNVNTIELQKNTIADLQDKIAKLYTYKSGFEKAVKVEKMKDVFVFGSNLAGRHGAGAAKFAINHHGAIYGQGIGLQGNSYAIPTKNKNLVTLPLAVIESHVKDFIKFANDNPDMKFRVTRVGCGLAGYTSEEIGPMFHGAGKNVTFFDPSWKIYLERNENANS